MRLFRIFTDGSCWNTKKDHPLARVGGIGLVTIEYTSGIESINEISIGKYIETTSIRMEMRAFLRALEITPVGSAIQIYCDNKMVCDAFNQLWIFDWDLNYRVNGDIWTPMFNWWRYHLERGSRINIFHVKGHTGIRHNERADELAGQARLEGKYKMLCRKVNIN
jgi:ribonuclease HI